MINQLFHFPVSALILYISLQREPATLACPATVRLSLFCRTNRQLRKHSQCLNKTFVWPSSSTVNNVEHARNRRKFYRPIFKVRVVFSTDHHLPPTNYTPHTPHPKHTHTHLPLPVTSVLQLSIIPAGFGLISSTGQLLWPQ